jgi:uncharacterized glyoxalase superfamily protein PhnB
MDDAAAEINQVIPVLVYEDIPRAHDFLVEVFGFEPGGVQHDGDGNAVHGEVIAFGTTLWLHAVSAEHRMGSPRASAASHGGFVVRVPDVDAHFERVRDAGAQIDSDPTDQEYGQREFGASDPEGHRWWFATPT